MRSTIHASRSAGGSVPPVLLIHELGGSHRTFRWLVGELGDVSTIAIDLPGSGASPVMAEGSTLADYAEAIVDFLRDEESGPVIILGIAVGAAMGTIIAARHPELVAGLIYCCMGPRIEPHTRKFLIDRCERVLRDGLEPTVETSLTSSFPETVRAGREKVFQTYRQELCEARVDGYVNQSMALAEAGSTVEENLCDVDVPMVVVAGAHDRHFSPEIVGRIAALAPREVGLVTLWQAAHLPHVQAPAQLAQVVRDFQRQIVGAVA